MALAPQKTLGELRDQLRARLGFAALGSAGGPNDTILDSFLSGAQEYLYWRYEIPRLRKQWTLTLGQDQNLLDFPDDCEPRRIKTVRVKVDSWYHCLEEGLDSFHESTMDQTAWPQRYEVRDQLRLWPKADQSYTVQLDGLVKLSRFTQDNDRATVDDEIVFLLALLNAKLHYRQPDANVYADQLQVLTASLASGAHGNTRYVPGGPPPADAVPPKLVT